MSYSENDLVPISSLQHFSFCPRQCALIHVEQLWHENMLTAEGRVMHDNAHSGDEECRGNVRISRGIALRSLELGITGVADVVEFHKMPDGTVRPFPVEYKHGKPKEGNCDRVQLCAQAICLEAMLNTQVPSGALFYGRTRRREDVAFTDDLRRETAELCRAVHALIESAQTPAPAYSKRCRSCSLYDLCMPKKICAKAGFYIDRCLKENEE
jgi:CRISPR-associated exonuclease Cas4